MRDIVHGRRAATMRRNAVYKVYRTGLHRFFR